MKHSRIIDSQGMMKIAVMTGVSPVKGVFSNEKSRLFICPSLKLT
jgi:hypothetical protein